MLTTVDLQGKLSILYHPQRHPQGHELLMSQLATAGLILDEFSRVSSPLEMQLLVSEGYGLALIPERTRLQPHLAARRILGANWTIDTALIYPKARHLKTLPVILRQLNQRYGQGPLQIRSGAGKRSPASDSAQTLQLDLVHIDLDSLSQSESA
jgi:hypothetical protein